MTLDEAARLLAEAGVDNPRGEARLLHAHAATDAARFAALVTRRAASTPFAYLTGAKGFWDIELDVGPGVLVPRPDTETLVEEAGRLYPKDAPLAIADLGTGSGAILLAALSHFPNAQGVGFESSPQAQPYAVANAARLAPGRATIVAQDWNTAPPQAFDLVFSNPPYIPAADIAGLSPEVRDHEPRAALDGGPDGLDAYRSLAALLPRIVRPGGHALLEIGIGQAPAMAGLFPGLELVRIVPDLAGIPRCVVLRRPQ